MKAIDQTDSSIAIDTADVPYDKGVEVERLAGLNDLEYDVVREDVAKRLGVRTSTLDKTVKEKRRELGLGAENKLGAGQGRAIQIPDVLPWHESVDGDLLATKLSCAIRNHIVLEEPKADAIALWIIHTWLVNQFQMTPRLAIYSPTKGCGKTTLLNVIGKMVCRPMLAISISPAAVFRVVETVQPTLLVDELKKFLETGSDMHGLLNAGHGKGMTVVRVIGDNLEPRQFNVFGAVAMGTLGKLPDDLQDRSIVIELKRKLASDSVSPFRDDRAEHLVELARQCARWADDYSSAVADVDPETPGLINRTADNWRPLFAIAEAIGGEWSARCAAAAKALSQVEDDSVAMMLLADIKQMFEAEDVDRLTSASIVEQLTTLDGRPWAEWKNGKPMSRNQLARLLKPFGIASETIRTGTTTAKGYYLHRFKDDFARYFGDTPSQSVTASQAPPNGHFLDFQSVTGNGAVTFQKTQKPASNGHCDGVTVQKGDGRVCVQCGEDHKHGALQFACFGGEDVLLHAQCVDAFLAANNAPEMINGCGLQ